MRSNLRKRRRRRQLKRLAYFVILTAVVVMCGVWSMFLINENESVPASSEQIITSRAEPEREIASVLIEKTEPEPVIHTIQIAAVGDILIHDRVYQTANMGDGRYDFTPMFSQVKPYLQAADIAFANQETMIGGVELGLSSYPCFNSPVEIGDALKDAGIDIVSMANNHTLDKNDKAVPRAIEHWNKIGMLYTGAYQSFTDQQIIRVIEKNEIKVAFLAYTYGTNGIPVPEGKEYLVNLMDKQKIKAEIDRAEEISDVVAISLHFGNEYERIPNSAQQEFVQFAVDEGADIILGTHPHVLQPFSWVEGKEGNRAFVMYSLGNFLSGQTGVYKQTGGIANIEIQKIITGDHVEITLQNPAFIPTYVYIDSSGYEIIPLNRLTNNDLNNAQGHYEEIKAHMTQSMPEMVFIEAEDRSASSK